MAALGDRCERVWLERSYHVATLDFDRDEIEKRATDFVLRVTGADDRGRPPAVQAPGDRARAGRSTWPAWRASRSEPDELDRFTEQLASVLAYAAEINELDVDGLEPMSHPFPLHNVLRADEPAGSLDRERGARGRPRPPRTTASWCRASFRRRDERHRGRAARRACGPAPVAPGTWSRSRWPQSPPATAEIHAFLEVLDDDARRRADAIDRAVAAGEDPGRLAGVPVALKDNLCTRGVPTTCSSRILAGWRPAL